jgi:hypothetical protein
MLKFVNVALEFLLEFGMRYHCLSLATDKCRLLIRCWIYFLWIWKFFITFVWHCTIYNILWTGRSILCTMHNILYIVYWIQLQCFPLYSNTTPMFYSKTMSRVLEQTLHFYILNPPLSWQWLWDNNPSSFLQACPSKYLVEHERVKSYISLKMNGLKITNNTELAIHALGQVHCTMPISVPKLGIMKILPPYIFSHECSPNYEGSYIAYVLPFHRWATQSYIRWCTRWTR